MTNDPRSEAKPRSITLYVILGAVLFAVIQSFHLLAPILLSFLLVMLITMAVNPVISRIETSYGGRKARRA
jgi:predicted PurR-regulated permease PerM